MYSTDKETLEEKYGISISYNDTYYMVFNYFGKLWFTAPTLQAIDEEMKRLYKILR